LQIEDDSYKKVSAENPMRLRLDAGRAADAAKELWPIAFDGEDYLLAGYSSEDAMSVNIVSLPEPVEGLPTTRGIGRTIRLFLFKKLGRHDDTLGLRRARLVGGNVEYGDIEKPEFRAGDRVALFVHGFGSDTKWMVEGLGLFLQEEVFASNPYDHLLTWDYETFGTSIVSNGEQLMLQLRDRCGLGQNDNITLHVYAHSMGALVSRCMIELSGGNQFVDRLLLAGPPNLGTTLATVTRGFIYLVSAQLNNISLIPLIGTTNWALKQLFELSPGLADLAVASPLVQRVNACKSHLTCHTWCWQAKTRRPTTTPTA
jgi:pimeloyl-ACP methyl ester carboxylesterase